MSSCVLLLGCSSLKSIEYIEDDDLPGGIMVESKVFKGTSFSVPDYYSTNQVDKHYKVGQIYYVQDLHCSHKTNKCTN